MVVMGGRACCPVVPCEWLPHISRKKISGAGVKWRAIWKKSLFLSPVISIKNIFSWALMCDRGTYRLLLGDFFKRGEEVAPGGN